MGHSAGASLAALICTDGSYLKAEGLSLTVIKGCVPVDGDAFDVPMQIKTESERGSKDTIRTFGDSVASHRELSAVTHIGSGRNIPPFSSSMLRILQLRQGVQGAALRPTFSRTGLRTHWRMQACRQKSMPPAERPMRHSIATSVCLATNQQRSCSSSWIKRCTSNPRPVTATSAAKDHRQPNATAWGTADFTSPPFRAAWAPSLGGPRTSFHVGPVIHR